MKADPYTVTKEDRFKKEKVIHYTTYYITVPHTKPCPNEDTHTTFLLVFTYEQKEKLTDLKTIATAILLFMFLLSYVSVLDTVALYSYALVKIKVDGGLSAGV